MLEPAHWGHDAANRGSPIPLKRSAFRLIRVPLLLQATACAFMPPPTAAAGQEAGSSPAATASPPLPRDSGGKTTAIVLGVILLVGLVAVLVLDSAFGQAAD